MDSLCFKGGILGFSSPISFGGGGGERSIDGRTHPAQVSALGGGGGGRSSSGGGGGGGGGGVSSSTNAAAVNGVGVSLENSTSTSQTRFSFTKPLGFLWGNGRNGNGGIGLDESVVVGDDVREEEEEEEEEVDIEEELLKEEISMGGGVDELTRIEDESRTSWVLKILHVRSLWPEQQERSGVGLMERVEKSEEDAERDPRSGSSGCDHEEFCGVCEEEQEKIEFDRDSFSRLLRRVSLTEAKVYAKMSYLGNLAYSIPKIKPVNLMKYHGLRFITSSVEKKALSTNIDIEKEQTPTQVQETEIQAEEAEEQRRHRYQISASAAYHIAASAASYLQSHTRSMISFKSSKDGTKEDSHEGDNETHGNAEPSSSEKASFVATSNSVTAVVAGKEEMKQAVAKKLNSAISSPCEWFICDDDESATRFFVIQGSETRASWQANLLFEPISFEGLDVLVHRGIYEAAKGIYEQMLPEVSAHIKSRGDSATLRFTGHSLGGSLALLVNLMLLIRGEVPLSSLLPVITFGAPSIMCGGDQLLRRLGLPRSHVRAITMHRDIVPRAFSCSYPDHVAELLKAVNGKFRNHPCLKNQKLLYSPMGEILILQPEEKFSPHHELLPSGSGLYLLDVPLSESGDAEKHLRAAQTVFFNSPHPLEILSDRSAYGSDGTIYRDHDMYSYLRSVLGVIRLEHNRIRKAKREHRRDVWWPLIAPGGIQTSIIIGRQVAPSNVMTQQHQLSFSGVLRTGRESVKRFSRLIASQHMHLLVVLLFPARLLLLGISFQ